MRVTDILEQVLQVNGLLTGTNELSESGWVIFTGHLHDGILVEIEQPMPAYSACVKIHAPDLVECESARFIAKAF